MSWKIACLSLPASLLAGAVMFASTAADAAERHRDYIYADSFGNLVVYSRAGYKRIVVGQGHLAGDLNAYVGGATEELAKLGPEEHSRPHDCYRPPVLVKGRSYMYGLMDGELPEPSGSCFRR